MNQLSPTQSRLLALGILLLMLILLFSLVIGPLVGRFVSDGESIADLKQQLDRYQSLAAELESSQRQLQRLQSENPASDLYLPEQKAALASARLQQHFNQLLDQSGGQVLSTQDLPLSRDELLPGVAIQVQIRAEIEQLVKLLYGLETSKPLLFVDDLEIIANPRLAVPYRPRRNSQVQSQQLSLLNVRFKLLGYTVPEVE